MIRYRNRRKRIRRLVLDEMAGRPELVERHREKRWTRIWYRIGFCVTAFLVVFGTGMGLAGISVVGLFLIGVNEAATWIVVGTPPKPALPSLLASFSLFAFSIMLFGAMRLRQNPINGLYRPWAAALPIPDAKLIGPYSVNLLAVALPLGLVAASAFIAAGSCWGWGPVQFARVFLMTSLSALCCWVAAEILGALLPRTVLVQSTLVTVICCLMVLVFAGSVVPRSVLEITKEESYGPIWTIPPAGWLVGVSGLLKPSVYRDWVLPFVVCVATFVGWLRVRKTFQLCDIQIGGESRVSAMRVSWSRAWSRPRTQNAYERTDGDLDKCTKLVKQRRHEILGVKRHGMLAAMNPMLPSSRRLACLGLLGIVFPRRGRLLELAWGAWPLALAIALVAMNQFVSLAGIPRFFRMLMIASFGLSLFDARELIATTDRGESTLGFSATRSVFPFSFWYMLRCLLLNRINMHVAALPGWTMALLLMATTDMPRNLLWNTPIIIAGISLTLPFVFALVYGVGNLRSSWRLWICYLAPLNALLFVYGVVLCIGVLGSVMTLRFDLAWWFLLALYGLVAIATWWMGTRLNQPKFDEGVVQLSRVFARR